MFNARHLMKNTTVTGIITVALISLTTFTASAVASGGSSASHSASPAKMQLKTSIQEVSGVRNIEAGNYQAGIRESNIALKHTEVRLFRAPILNNLCVAHIALGELQHAKDYCDRAVAASSHNTIALNNRAVLHCLTNKTDACVTDLETAEMQGAQNQLVQRNLVLAKQQNSVAKLVAKN